MLADKPRWPLVRSPYLLPSQIMFWAFCFAILLQDSGWAAVSTLAFWIGLLALVYAYRKQPPQRASEKKWWRDFRAHSRGATRTPIPRLMLATLAGVFLIFGAAGLALHALAPSYEQSSAPTASLTLLVLGTACVAFLSWLPGRTQ